MTAWRRAGGLLALVLVAACGDVGERDPADEAPLWFEPSRQDWAAFRSSHPGLPEPNYLPFLLHRLRTVDPRGDALVFCRWDASQMPIAVAIDPPSIADEERRAIASTPPAEYVAAVVRALDRFEEMLGGAVRFTRDDGPSAALRVRMIGERAPVPEPDLQVLGAIALGGACRLDPNAPVDPSSDRLAVRYAAREVRLFIADEHGLLTTDQVERVALHEIGHAMGMRGHSPLPADLMFEAASDREPNLTFSIADVHSFRGLYALPNGTVYAFIGRDDTRLPVSEAAGTVVARLDPVARRDRRSGITARFPEGWLVADGPRGLLAVDGTMWDYAASLQLIVEEGETPERHLARHRAAHVGNGFLRREHPVSSAGRPGVRLELESPGGDRIEQVTLIALTNERMLLMITDSLAARSEATAALFDAVLDSVRSGDEPRSDRLRSGVRP